jgi:uncharacterized OsmC-like protein
MTCALRNHHPSRKLKRPRLRSGHTDNQAQLARSGAAARGHWLDCIPPTQLGGPMGQVQTTQSVNGIDLSTLKETVNAIQLDGELGKCRFRARNQWMDANHNRTTISSFYGAGQEMRHKQEFELHADEPPILAGKDEGANPVEHLLHALASCMTTSLVAHAAVRGIEIQELESELEGDIDLRGFLGLDPNIPKGYTNIRVKFKIKTDETDTAKLQSLAAFSPVYNTLINGTDVHVNIQRL